MAVTLKNGQLITGKFLRRATNNRWIEVSVPWGQSAEPVRGVPEVVRIQRAEIAAFSIIKGTLDLKKLGRTP